MTAAGMAWAVAAVGRIAAAKAAVKRNFSSECSSYVEAEEFGFVALLFQYRLGEIEPQRTERRNPVDADADRKAGLRRIAENRLP